MCNVERRVFFVAGEELKQFTADQSQQVNAVAYEWEGENVFHLHFSHVNHSFGKTHSVLFLKGEFTPSLYENKDLPLPE